MTHSGEKDVAYCTVCDGRSLRAATFGKRCDLLRPDLTRCPGILQVRVTPPATPDHERGSARAERMGP